MVIEIKNIFMDLLNKLARKVYLIRSISSCKSKQNILKIKVAYIKATEPS